MTMLEDEIYDFLEHHGVKGMHWGVRNTKKSQTEQPTGEKSHAKRNAAIILGSAAVIAAVAVGGIYAKKHMDVSTSSLPKASSVTKKFAESMAKEPVGIVHAARGKHHGFTFPQHGGLDAPLKEYEKAGFVTTGGGGQPAGYFHRYGDRLEKVAATFKDPENRKDFAGRPILHEVMLPESLASGITSHDQVEPRIWPLIKDTYQALYDRKQGG